MIDFFMLLGMNLNWASDIESVGILEITIPLELKQRNQKTKWDFTSISCRAGVGQIDRRNDVGHTRIARLDRFSNEWGLNSSDCTTFMIDDPISFNRFMQAVTSSKLCSQYLERIVLSVKGI